MGQLSRTAKLLCWSILLTFQKLMIEALLRPPVSSAGHQCVGRGRSGLFVPGAIEGTTGLVCHCRKWNCSRQLDARRGIRTTRLRRPRGGAFANAHPASTASCPVRDDLEPSLVRQDVEGCRTNLGRKRTAIFCRQDWTAQITLIRQKKLDLSRKAMGKRGDGTKVPCLRLRYAPGGRLPCWPPLTASWKRTR